LSSIARAAKVMALVRDAGYEQPTLWIAHVDGTGLRKVANGEGGALSPDGTRVATAWSPWGRNGIRIVDVATGAARTLVAHGSSPSWSPDGRTIAYAAAGPCLNLGVYVVAAAGGSPRRITNDCRIVGTPKNDVLLGTSERDVMRGLGGNDVIRANPGDRPPDHYGNWDFDFVDGGPGDDTITGARGIDVLLGGPGNDHIFGGAGPDTLYGGPGRDVLDGGRYHDRIFAADDERDVVRCGTGEDHVVADRIDVLSKCNHVTFR
jgi:Ca2+-binding RTX toxin-like protein